MVRWLALGCAAPTQASSHVSILMYSKAGGFRFEKGQLMGLTPAIQMRVHRYIYAYVQIHTSHMYIDTYA